jgi:hypothetical protein
MFICLFLFLFTTVQAPLPAPIAQAKTVFLVNNGAESETFDFFYEEIRAWKRYEVAESPDKSDLTFEISVITDKSVYTNPANLRTYSYDTEKIKLSIFQANTLLWSNTQAVKGSKEKDRIKAVKKIVDDLKKRVR